MSGFSCVTEDFIYCIKYFTSSTDYVPSYTPVYSPSPSYVPTINQEDEAAKSEREERDALFAEWMKEKDLIYHCKGKIKE